MAIPKLAVLDTHTRTHLNTQILVQMQKLTSSVPYTPPFWAVSDLISPALLWIVIPAPHWKTLASSVVIE